VLSFFFSRPNWDSPTPSPARRRACLPPLVRGGGEAGTHSFAGEGVRGSQFQRGDRHCGTLGIYVLCGQEFLPCLPRLFPFRFLMSTWLSSNCVASLLQPSCYDSIIMIKKLPYLPDIIPSSSGAYSIFVEDFMMKVSTETILRINQRKILAVLVTLVIFNKNQKSRKTRRKCRGKHD
jgi:hypothetical protein